MNSLWKWITDLKKECPDCNGKGKVHCHCNENNEIICPNCNGKGTVEKSVVINQKMEVPCDNPHCHEGKVQCAVCHGTGVKADGEVCATCKGKGVVDCPVCFGLDKIQRNHHETWQEHITCHLCQGKRYVPCPLCEGTKEKVCPTCEGEGEVWDKGKILLLAVGAGLVLLLPVLGISVALLTLGYTGFCFWKQKEK